jgi:hypothetical protein
MRKMKIKCDCGNIAEWEAKGNAVRFGVALTTYHCTYCKTKIGDRSEPKITYGGPFKIDWRKLDAEEV